MVLSSKFVLLLTIKYMYDILPLGAHSYISCRKYVGPAAVVPYIYLFFYLVQHCMSVYFK